MPKEKTVVVIGATGQQGGATAVALLERGYRVRAFVRDAKKEASIVLRERGADLVEGDLDDLASLRRAMSGADGVFCVLTMASGGVEGEVRHGRNAAEAAKEAKIAHFVYSSVGGAERKSGIPHFESKARVEECVRSLGLPFTFLRPVFFLENFANPAMSPKIEDGSIVVRMALHPTTKLQMVTVHDIATFAVLAFDRPSELLGQALELAGDDLSMLDIAKTFQRVTGTPARFEELPIARLRGFSEETATMFEWFEKKGYDADIPALRKLSPGLRDLETWLRETGWKAIAARGAPKNKKRVEF